MTGNPTRFFHRNLVDDSNILPSVFFNLGHEFDKLFNHFKSGDHKHIFSCTYGLYSSVLIQLKRTPFYKAVHETFGGKGD